MATGFTLWVDADACPRAAKDLLFRAAERLQVRTVLVANGPLSIPRSQVVSTVQVGAGLNVADDWIAEQARPGDVAITADIPLAARLVPKGVAVLDPRGTEFDEDNIAERLSVRDFMQELRDSGVQTGGPGAFDARDRQQFANALDRALQRALARRA